jgi:two-component system, cell cycle response regulator
MRRHTKRATGYTLLVVDDDPDYLRSTARLLETEGHRVLVASDGSGALEILSREAVHLALVDHSMPGLDGPELINQIRSRDSLVQILLVTGHGAERSGRDMVRSLAIQGYHEKADGAERLLVWIDSALRAYEQVAFAARHRRTTEHMLELCPEFLALRSEDAIASVLLRRARDVADTFARVPTPRSVGRAPDGLVVLPPVRMSLAELDDGNLPIRLATGRFQGALTVGALPPAVRGRVRRAVERSRVMLDAAGAVIPIRTGPEPWGFAYLENVPTHTELRDLFEALAVLVAASLRNARLLRVATDDQVTETDSWHYFTARLRRVLRRASYPAGVPVVGVGVEGIRDILRVSGSVAADLRLRQIGARLATLTREHGRVAYRGGSQFAILARDRSEAAMARLIDVIGTFSHELGGGDQPSLPPVSLRVCRLACPAGSASADAREEEERLDAAIDAFERDFDLALAARAAPVGRRANDLTAGSESSAPPPRSPVGNRR